MSEHNHSAEAPLGATTSHGRPIARREFLKGALAAAGVATIPAIARSAAAQARPYAPFRMGIQSYTLRGYKLDEALAKTKELGLRNWESFSAHIPLTTDPAQIAEIQAKLKASNVRLRAHGVTGFGADKAANRKVFEAAKAMGIEVISADPAPESFDQLNGLVQEFDIRIAIHNHGPGARYDKLPSVLEAVKGKDVRFGACVDAGHVLRSAENPVDWVKALGERVHGVHLKDVKDTKTFTVLGKGDLPLVPLLRELKGLNFRQTLALEYEEHPENPIADVQECLAAVRDALAKL